MTCCGPPVPVKGGHPTRGARGQAVLVQAPANALTAAIKEYGALRRTVYAARHLANAIYPRRIARQLNKGENLHSLRSPARPCVRK